MGDWVESAGRVELSPQASRAAVRGHPWVFDGAVVRVSGQPGPGDVVEVVGPGSAWLGFGFYNPKSTIRVRIFAWDPEVPAERDFWLQRLRAAATRREGLSERPARRLVYSEADDIPGLVVDRFGDYLSVQFLTAGVEQRRELLVQCLADTFRPKGIWERNDPTRGREGLPPSQGLLWGQAPPERLPIREGGVELLADLRGGQKTGLYLDQAENRIRLAGILGRANTLLDAFSHAGAFGLHALAAGAGRVTLLDASPRALALAEESYRRAGIEAGRYELVRGNAFQVLRRWRDEGRRFDAVVLDPPKFVPKRQALQRGTRAYKDVNWLAMRLLRPGGLLATFSCSGLVGWDLHWKVLRAAAADAGVRVHVLARLGQASDHPIPLTFPEAEYLTGFLLQVA